MRATAGGEFSRRWSRSFDRLAVLSLSHRRSPAGDWVGSFDQGTLAFAIEGKILGFTVPVNANQVPNFHLLGGQEVGERIDDVAFDGAFQVPRSVTLVRALLQQKVPRRTGHPEQELPARRFQ